MFFSTRPGTEHILKSGTDLNSHPKAFLWFCYYGFRVLHSELIHNHLLKFSVRT